jgi:hypothetical protein
VDESLSGRLKPNHLLKKSGSVLGSRAGFPLPAVVHGVCPAQAEIRALPSDSGKSQGRLA